MSDIKLASMMADSGAPLVRVAAFFSMGVNTVKKYIDAYKSKEIVITHEDIEKSCDGETLKIGYNKLKSMGLTHDIEWLRQWCNNHDVNYLRMCKRQYKFSDEKIAEIEKLLELGEIMSDIARVTGVSETTVWKVASNSSITRKPKYRVSDNTTKVIEILNECANPMTTLEVAVQVGITNKQVQTAVKFVRSRPADYELVQGYRGPYSTYRITAISSKRKSEVTNNKRKTMRDMIEAGFCNDAIAERFKCKPDTVENVRQSIAPREKITKPDINPMMAMALGMKVK